MNETESSVVNVFDDAIQTLPIAATEQGSLEATSQAFFSMVEHIRQEGIHRSTASRLNLHYLTYPQMRRLYPDEGSQLVSLAVHRASRMLKNQEVLPDGLMFDLDRNLSTLVLQGQRFVLSVRSHGGRLHLPVDMTQLSAQLKEHLSQGLVPRIITGALFRMFDADQRMVVRVIARLSPSRSLQAGDASTAAMEIAA